MAETNGVLSPKLGKRGHEGLFCTESEYEGSTASQQSVFRTKKVKLEVVKKNRYGMRPERDSEREDAETRGTEGSRCEVNDKEKEEAMNMDMTEALMGAQDRPERRQRYITSHASP
jgi:hypothetical protein